MKIKPLFAVCFILASLATMIAAGFVGTNLRGRSAWERYADDAKRRGVKMSLQELLPPPVPDAENFAMVPLFANLFSEDKAVRDSAAKALDIPRPENSAETRSIGDARLIDLPGWQAAFVKSGDLASAGPDPATDILAAIEHRCGPALVELAEAERRPHAVFPVKWDLGFYALLPHLSVIQNAARIHHLRMAAHLERKDRRAAAAEFRGLLRLYRALEKEPILITGLVRVSILNLAENGVWQGVMKSAWEASDLAEMQQELAPFDLLVDYCFSMSGERAGINDVLDRMRNGHSFARETEGIYGIGSGESSQIALRALSYFPGWVGYNQIAINRFHDAHLQRIDPAGARFHDVKTAVQDLEATARAPVKSVFYGLYVHTAPAVSVVEKTFLFGHTNLQLTRLACALEQHRADTGAYPEKLEALAPKYIEAIPHDVIDGEPLSYRRTDDARFLLYSVAMNAEDDGGARGEKAGVRDHLDWAWRWPAPESAK